MKQTWRDLLFLHWKVDADMLRATLPGGLHLDTFKGEAWVGVVPFFMDNIRPSFLPPVPGLSWFLETNLRTYVYDDAGNSGAWFYSLDANLRIATMLGKSLFRLPYRFEKMSAVYKSQTNTISNSAGARKANWIDYRYSGNHFVYQKHPTEKLRGAEPRTLEFFLFERYLLFASSPNGIKTGQVHHTPYQICETQCETVETDLFSKAGLDIKETHAELMHFSPGVNVEVFALK